jgi:DnaK suppressor protein
VSFWGGKSRQSEPLYKFQLLESNTNHFVDDSILMAKGKANKRGLTSGQIRRFKAMLLAKRTEILGNVSSMEDEALRKSRTDLSNMPIHMADAGTDNYETENILGLMDSERRLLLEIEDALDRIENGTYGICEGGGEPILAERLEVIPWARYCVACASLSEKGLLSAEVYFDETDYGEQAGEEQYDDFGDSYGQ